MKTTSSHKAFFKGTPMLAVLAVIALLVGQGVAVHHDATYGGRMHSLAAHSQQLIALGQDSQKPAKQSDADGLCDFALFAHGAALLDSDGVSLPLLMMAHGVDQVAPSLFQVSTYRHLRPPGRAPPLISNG